MGTGQVMFAEQPIKALKPPAL